MTQEKTTSISRFLGIIKGVLAFIFVTLSLYHVFFDARSSELTKERAYYKSIVKERDDTNKLNLDRFINNKITKEEYIVLVESNFILYKNKLKASSQKKKELANLFSFRGRSSFHFWVFVFGLVTALFFFSCKSLHDDISRGSTFRFQLVSLSGIVVSLFWVIHLLFYTQKDFQQNKYLYTILVCAVLFSGFTYLLVKYYSYKDNIIYKQLSFLERIKTIYYNDMLSRAIYAEESGRPLKSDKSVKDSFDEFQEDLKKITANI